jgi:ubiquitin-protein ligase
MDSNEALAILDKFLHSKPLSYLQELVFCKSWEGKTYQEIASDAGYDFDYVREVGSSLWNLLSSEIGEKVTKKNIQSVLRRYKQEQEAKVAQQESGASGDDRSLQLPKVDWGEAVEVSSFYGHEEELSTLKQWIEQDFCRMIAILGMGGMGKTALSIALTEEVYPGFDYTIWRSLRRNQSVADLLESLIKFLRDQNPSEPLPAALADQISMLIECLRNRRCLIILDGAEAILEGGDRAGVYAEELVGYGELFRRVAESQHQSCLILTSREQPQEFTLLEGAKVRSLFLKGLDTNSGRSIFEEKGKFSGADAEWDFLINHYAGNPQLLKVIASTVQEFFGSDISLLVAQIQSDRWVFEGVRQLLDEHFARLSESEKRVLYWLTVTQKCPT